MSRRAETESQPVGISGMEAEHELLHAILHDLQRALVDGGDEVGSLVERFEEVANAHFMEEQALMRLHAYPGYAAHQEEHDELIGELRRLTGRIESGETVDAARMAEKLEDWLVVHMRTTDEAFEEFLRRDGIRPRSPG